MTKARDLLRQNRLGGVIAADIEFNRYMPEHRYRTIKDPLLADMLIHQFDMIRFVLGMEPEEVVCWSWNPPGSPFAHDAAAAAMIRMAGGAVVTLRGSWLSREASTNWAGSWRIECADGVIRFSSRSGADTDLAGDHVALRRLGAERDEDVALDPMPLFGRTASIGSCRSP